jgi:outer membrane protein OmpA-like peptidoglycan-associated protein/outer membrane protein W
MMGTVDRFVKPSLLWVTWGLISCIATFGALLPNLAFAQGADAPIALDIPAQSLGTALNSLAVQANLQIFFEQDPVAGLEAPAINGTMTPKQALQILLSDTTLAYAQNADGTLVVTPKAKVAARRPVRKPTRVAEAPAAPPAPTPAAPVFVPQSVRDSEGPWMLRARALYLAPHNKSDAFEVPGLPPSLVPQDGARSNDRWAPELDAEYFFTSHWSTELALNFPQVHSLLLQSAALGGGSGNVGSFRLMPDFLTIKYGLLPEQAFRPYVGIGVNVTSIYTQRAAPFTLSKTTAGPAAQAGFDIRLSNHWSLNADVKWARSRPAVDFDGQSAGHLKLDPLLFGIGIGYRFGGSPPSAPVALIAPVPAPPPVDSDGDGVPDSIDRCPNTPRGVAVDAAGCPLDSDNDGVPDYLDKCPGTPAGLKVDANGCEIEELVLTGVTFETASAKLTPESSGQLDKVVAVLRLRPNSKTEIHGYTDSRGSDAYNQKLSERRASAVVEYLVEHGISGPGLSARGFGKSNPVAGNETADGRAQNRRVTVQFSRPVPRQ